MEERHKYKNLICTRYMFIVQLHLSLIADYLWSSQKQYYDKNATFHLKSILWLNQVRWYDSDNNPSIGKFIGENTKLKLKAYLLKCFRGKKENEPPANYKMKKQISMMGEKKSYHWKENIQGLSQNLGMCRKTQKYKFNNYIYLHGFKITKHLP